MGLQIIDCVKEGELEALDILEGYWQNMLATFQIHDNINVRNEWRNYMGQQPILFLTYLDESDKPGLRKTH